MLLNSIYGTGLTNNGGCGCNNGWGGCANSMSGYGSNMSCGCNSCNNCGCNNGCGCGNSISNYGSNLGNAAYCFIGEWVNIVVTLTILQSILGLVCNWNCGNGSC